MLQIIGIRVDYTLNQNSNIYNYYASCFTYKMHGKSIFNRIEWVENVPHTQIVDI